MATAFKCDNCGKLFEGAPRILQNALVETFVVQVQIYWSITEDSVDLCTSCYKSIVKSALGLLVNG